MMAHSTTGQTGLMVKTTVRIPVDLFRRVKIAVAHVPGASFQTFVNDALLDALKKEKPRRSV